MVKYVGARVQRSVYGLMNAVILLSQWFSGAVNEGQSTEIRAASR